MTFEQENYLWLMTLIWVVYVARIPQAGDLPLIHFSVQKHVDVHV